VAWNRWSVQRVLQPVDLGERLGGTGDVPERDRPVEADHRGWVDGRQHRVQGEHLTPVGGSPGGSLTVDGGNRGLDLVRPRPAERGGSLDETDRAGDGAAVPEGSVLVLEQHQLSSPGQPCRPAGQVEPDQREQAERFGLVGQEPHHQAGQPLRVPGDVAAEGEVARGGQVTLVEHEVEDGEDLAEPLAVVVGAGHTVGDASDGDLAFGADNPLGDGGFGDDECAGDLRRGQPCHRSQGERHLRVPVERGVAAGEDQSQPVIRLAAGRVLQSGEQRQLVAVPGVPAYAVEPLATGGGEQPRPGAIGDTVARPVLERLDQRG